MSNSFTPNKIRASFLIQLRLIYHHTTTEGTSTYQANTQSVYELLRKGKLVQLAREKHGNFAAHVIEELSILGSATLSELEERFPETYQDMTWSPTDPQTTALNLSVLAYNQSTSRNSREAQSDSGPLIDIVRHLLSDGYIQIMKLGDFQTVHDACQDAEMRFRGIGIASLLKSKKQREELEEKIHDEVRKQLNSQTIDAAHSAANGVDALGVGKALTDSVEKLEDTLVLSVNFSPLITALRDDILDNMINKTFGDTYARVSAAAFKQIPLDSDRYRTISGSESDSHLQALDISRIESAMIRPYSSIIAEPSALTNGWHDEHEPTVQHNPNAFRSKTDDTTMRKDEISTHLGILAETKFDFLTHGGTADLWIVDKSILAKFVRESEILRLMSERLDPPGLRIVRMLIDKGRLDENTLQELGLLGAKELRQNLAQLHTMGFLELQEVPREPQRQPNRTIFLWFFDPNRVRRALLRDIYKAMGRILQRLRLEREKLASTLSKIERSDVKGSEEELLPPEELVLLQQWRRKEEWLLGEISRLDDSVIILRDLH